MPFITIPSADVDQGSVVDESLMSGKIKNDLDDLNARTVALEAISGGGGVASTKPEELFAEIIAGGADDVARFYKTRHHPMMSATGQKAEPSNPDFDQKDMSERFLINPLFQLGQNWVNDANAYMGKYLNVPQNEQVSFKIKTGENFFWLGLIIHSTGPTVVRIYVDGVNVNTLGLTDENGTVVPAQISVNNPTVRYAKQWQYYGLDGREHIVSIKNENASAQSYLLDSIDVGYRPNDFAIDHTVKVFSGAANVGGAVAEFNEQSFTFAKPTEGLTNGHTGMVKITQAGILSAVDGLSPASTQCKPNVNIPFSGGAVTTLNVKNHYAFPTKGICLFSHPHGETYVFAYNGKGGGTTAQSQTLDSLTWERQPIEDLKPKAASAAALWVANEYRGDARIDYIAKAPIEIDGTNNKVDFDITINGVTTSHTATIPSGLYAADIMRIGNAFVSAMRTAKPLTRGDYFMSYNSKSQLWSYGVTGSENSAIKFKWATGANSATSFKTIVGATSDQLGQQTYIGPSIKQHLAIRVFYADKNMRSTEHPTQKYTEPKTSTFTALPHAESAVADLGLPGYRVFANANSPVWEIYPDDDCCGISLAFGRMANGSYIKYTIDDMDLTDLGTTGRPADSTEPTKATVIHFFISFPKGSRKITVRASNSSYLTYESGSGNTVYYGYRQYFTKPQWETLAPTEKVLKTFEVAPNRLFCTPYGAQVATQYIPQASNDNINTLTETGTWAAVSNTAAFNYYGRRSSTNGSYFECEFVLQGDGGGFGYRSLMHSTSSYEIAFYLSKVGIVEATDQLELIETYSVTANYQIDPIVHLGLKAGTYKARVKIDGTGGNILDCQAILIYDTVPPQPGATTNAEISNTGQAPAYPINVVRRMAQRFAAQKRPLTFTEGEYGLGVVNHTDYITTAHSFLGYEDTGTLETEIGGSYYGHQVLSFIGSYYQNMQFCRSLAVLTANINGGTLVVQPSVDGVNAASTFSTYNDTKGGIAPTGTHYSYGRQYVKDFERAITFNAGLTFNMGFTQGLRTNAKVILYDGTNYEVAHIDSFVFDTSFTIKVEPSVVVKANVIKVFYWGLHTVKVTSSSASSFKVSCFEYEPLPLQWSILEQRVQSVASYETKLLNQNIAATGTTAGAYSRQTFQYPLHSDGEEASQTDVEIVPVDFSFSTSRILEIGSRTMRHGTAATALAAVTLITRSKKLVSKLAVPFVRG